MGQVLSADESDTRSETSSPRLDLTEDDGAERWTDEDVDTDPTIVGEYNSELSEEQSRELDACMIWATRRREACQGICFLGDRMLLVTWTDISSNTPRGALVSRLSESEFANMADSSVLSSDTAVPRGEFSVVDRIMHGHELREELSRLLANGTRIVLGDDTRILTGTLQRAQHLAENRAD